MHPFNAHRCIGVAVGRLLEDSESLLAADERVTDEAGPEFVVNEVLRIHGDRHARWPEQRGRIVGALVPAALIPSSRRPESASAFP